MRRIVRRLVFDGAAGTPAIERSLRGEQGGITLDARRMSISTRACYGFTAHHPGSSARKATPHNFFGGVAVGGLVLGCVWTVYANVFGASIYPAVTGNFDVAVVKRPVAGPTAPPAANRTIGMESPPAVAAPATVLPGPSLSFDDRFGAAAAQGEPSKSQTDAPK